MTSKLVQMQARFQQKQMQEKEEKLLKLYENQQQRAFDRVGRGSAGSNDSLHSSNGGLLGGKVRQMFDERRQKAGIDKSYPLEPLKSKSNTKNINIERKNGTVKTTVKSTVQSSTSVVRNGKPLVKKREVVNRLYENDNGKEAFETNRYIDDGTDAYHSKSYREMIEMLDNNNSSDSLENEEMPRIGFDEVDHTQLYEKDNNLTNNNNSNGTVKKLYTKSPVTNGVTARTENSVPKKNNNLSNTKRNSAANSPITPKTSTPSSPAKKITSTATMNDKSKSLQQAPSSSRPSAKQQSPRSVVTRDDLTECNYCGRRFAEDRVQKHEEVCSKTGKKKRKAYDATKHRVMGTELESYILPSKGKAKANNMKVSTKNPPKKDWRRTHEEFIAAIRAAKEAQTHLAKGGKLSDLPPPPPSTNPDYVQCPHCNRRFNEAAAERHIPKCADYQFNKPKPGASKTKPTYGKK
uniref:Zinc finger C2HC domain-containing protein 1C-like n=1 Tax=Diabrotica virgifera virgifera TaxID=50390 RepID=A0A6P7GER9_DIAVI